MSTTGEVRRQESDEKALQEQRERLVEAERGPDRDGREQKREGES